MNLKFNLTLLLSVFVLFLSCSENENEKEVTQQQPNPPSIDTPVVTGSSSSLSPEMFPIIDWTTPSSKGPKFYVSLTTGDDSRSLEQAKNPNTPWKTIQKAANTIEGGSTVIISGGVYKEKIIIPKSCSGTPTSQTIFINKDKETVIIDGEISNSNEKINRFVSQVQIKDADYVTIKGIQVQNVSWYGIASEDSDNVTIENCIINNSGASGIYAKIGNNISAIGNKVTKACQVLKRDVSNNGTQECITFAAIDKFRISYNEVADSEVGDSAGGEGIDAKGGSSNGEISKNYVHDIKALGIYVDAGSFGSGLSCGAGAQKPPMTNIRVFSNKVYRTNGVRIAGELGGVADNIYFYNNIIKESIKTGFVFNVPGKFECNGTTFPNAEVGTFTNVYIVNNTFYNDGINAVSGDFIGSIVSFNGNPKNRNVVIKNNIIYSAPSAKLSLYLVEKKGFEFSNNLFFNFKPGVNYTSVNNSLDFQADPLFKNPNANDFSLQSNSPAKDKGVPIIVNGKSLMSDDILGKQRGTMWDIGAHEL